MKQFFLVGLAAIGGYALFEWWKNNPRSWGGPNPVASEVAGVSQTNFSDSGQLTSGVPTFDQTPIANGHGDQIVAAYHDNPLATLPGGANYEPAFGPRTNRG